MATSIDVTDKKWKDFRDHVGREEGAKEGYTAGRTGNAHLGRYQFGEQLLEDLKYYNKDCSKSIIDWVGTWTGKGKINSREDFINSPAAQDAAFDDAMKLRLAWIRKKKLDQFVGKVVGGVLVTWGGLLAAAWLCPVFILRFINSGGTDDPADKGGETASKRLRKFASDVIPFTTSTGYEPPRLPQLDGWNPACPVSHPLNLKGEPSGQSGPNADKPDPYYWLTPKSKKGSSLLLAHARHGDRKRGQVCSWLMRGMVTESLHVTTVRDAHYPGVGKVVCRM